MLTKKNIASFKRVYTLVRKKNKLPLNPEATKQNKEKQNKEKQKKAVLLKKYASFKANAHDIVYSLENKNQQSIELLEEDNSLTPYKVDKINVKTPGLYGYILSPHAPHKENKIPEFKIVFRGTKGFASIHRDAEPTGAGATSFALEAGPIVEQIVQMLRKKTEEFPTNTLFSLFVGGHSLGGSDAQNCMVALMDYINKNPTNFTNLKTFKIFIINSTGISEENGRKGAQLAVSLKNQLKHLNLESYTLYSNNDFIQKNGQAHLFSNIKNPDIVKVDVLVLHSLIDLELKLLLPLLILFAIASFSASLLFFSHLGAAYALTMALSISSALGLVYILKKMLDVHRAVSFKDEMQIKSFESLSNKKKNPSTQEKHQEIIAQILNEKYKDLEQVQESVHGAMSYILNAKKSKGARLSPEKPIPASGSHPLDFSASSSPTLGSRKG